MNIYDVVYENNQNHLNKLALSVTMDDTSKRSYTYGQMFNSVEKYANVLLKSGVQKGDRIAIACEGSPEWTIAFFAILKLNCTAALIDASLDGDEIYDFIETSDVRAAYLSPKVFKKCDKAKSFLFPILNVYDGNVFEGCSASVKLGATADPDASIATIIYSSGTTRKAAGIMHAHDSLINTTQMTLDVQHLNADDRFLAIIPNSHIYGVICLVLGPHLIGGDVHYIESLSGEAVLNAFSEYHPTILSAVPKVYELFYAQILRKINGNPMTRQMFKTFFPICLKKRYQNGSLLGKKLFKSIHEGFGGSIRVLCSAGSPLSKEVAEFYYGTGFNILITYGASETNIPTIGNTAEDLSTDSCGKPYPAVSLKISDEGELLLKSPFMMKGYFRDEESNATAFTEDGWFKSGDIGFQDEKGNIHITGRLKENIVLATGKKITPTDVETHYANIDGAKEFVACGVPADQKDYDEIHAFIVPENNSKEALDKLREQIKARGAELRQNLRISRVHFLQEIPKTSLQKPKRYLLRKQALSESPSDTTEVNASAAKNDAEAKVIEILAKIANTDASTITVDTKIFSDLPIDSLSAINLALELEDTFKVNIEKYYNDAMTVADILLALQGKGKEAESIGQDNIAYPQDKSNADYRAYSFFRSLARTFHKITVRGEENIPTHCGFIICANHVSKIDYLYISSTMSRERYMKLCCMAKKELFRNDPFSRRLIKSAGMVPMDRGGMNKKSMQNLEKRLHEKWGVVIHPEGTRSEDGIFRTMKSGAATLAIDAGVPIIPAYIDGMFPIFPKGKKMPRFIDWKHFKKFSVTVTFGKPISSRGTDVQKLTEDVQNAILELQKVNCTLPLPKELK